MHSTHLGVHLAPLASTYCGKRLLELTPASVPRNQRQRPQRENSRLLQYRPALYERLALIGGKGRGFSLQIRFARPTSNAPVVSGSDTSCCFTRPFCVTLSSPSMTPGRGVREGTLMREVRSSPASSTDASFQPGPAYGLKFRRCLVTGKLKVEGNDDDSDSSGSSSYAAPSSEWGTDDWPWRRIEVGLCSHDSR